MVEQRYQAVLAVLDGASVVEVASRLEVKAPDGAPMAALVWGRRLGPPGRPVASAGLLAAADAGQGPVAR